MDNRFHRFPHRCCRHWDRPPRSHPRQVRLYWGALPDPLPARESANVQGSLGENALISNAGGLDNAAIGFLTLLNNTTGGFNTAIGSRALPSNTTGSNNIAIGNSAGVILTTGNDNIDIGNIGVAGDFKTIRIGKQGRQTDTFIAGIRGQPFQLV